MSEFLNRAKYRSSLLTLILLSLIVFSFRITHMNRDELSWDVLGYYMYLPAAFIYDDPLLDNTAWLEKVNRERNLTGTLYQVSTNDKGEPMFFFLYGMAIFYLPFFLAGHGIAFMAGFPTDGFSEPYNYSLVFGGIVYALIGLIFLRKILLHFFSDERTSLLLLLLFFGTNYLHHITLKNLETVNILFMLLTLVTWFTIRWEMQKKNRDLLIIGICITLMTLVKPSEIFILIIPLLWGIDSFQAFRTRISLLFSIRKQLFVIAGICLVLVLPQLFYWHLKTGKWIYDSYKNPGVGLDFLSPHIMQILFSFRKGWLVYTPLMLFCLSGFYFLKKENKRVFIAISFYFAVTFYVISSWTEWWYGAGFSNRPLITSYPLLMICLGYFLNYLSGQRWLIKTTVGLIMLMLVVLNQFQWWQFRNGILDPYRETKKHYMATFLKTSVSDTERKLLLLERDFTGQFHFDHPEQYLHKLLERHHFKADNHSAQPDSASYSMLEAGQEFSESMSYPFSDLTGADHAWLKAGIEIRYPEGFSGTQPLLVMTMSHDDKSYAYTAAKMERDTIKDGWQYFGQLYLTPEIRSVKDRFSCYVWNRGKQEIEIRNFTLELFTPREGDAN